jgi:hypothetical protein
MATEPSQRVARRDARRAVPEWLIGPAIAVGPMLLILMFIYLGLSSDTETP